MPGQPPPAKPWQQARAAGASASTPGAASASPLGPSTAGDGGPKPWEQPQSLATAAQDTGSSSLISAPPARPWLNTSPTFAQPSSSYGSGSTLYGGGGYGGYGTGMYSGSSGYGSSMYGRPGYGSQYGGHGSSGYGSGGYGGGYGMGGYGGGMYGGGMYGGGGGGMMGPYGSGPQGAFGPEGPPRPPSAWEAVMRGLHGIMSVFGRISFLVDENTASVHFFISALLRLLDGFGSLYGELARFVLRMLGWGRPKKIAEGEAQQQGALMGPAAPQGQTPGQQAQPTFCGASGQQQAAAGSGPSPVMGGAVSPTVASGEPPGTGSGNPGGWDSAWGGGRRPLP